MDFIDYETLQFSRCRRGSTRTHDGWGRRRPDFR